MPKKLVKKVTPKKSEKKYAYCKDGKTKFNIMESKSYLPNGWYTFATTTKEFNADLMVKALNAADPAV